MTKEQFIKLMETIKDRYYKLEQIYDNIETAFGDVGDSFVEDTSIMHIIEVVAEIIGDTNNWIDSCMSGYHIIDDGVCKGTTGYGIYHFRYEEKVKSCNWKSEY